MSEIQRKELEALRASAKDVSKPGGTLHVKIYATPARISKKISDSLSAKPKSGK
jgi:hypothetical protein